MKVKDILGKGSPVNESANVRAYVVPRSEVEAFLNNYAGKLTDDDVGILYNEEFSDRYTDDQIDAQVLDADMARAAHWRKTGVWPSPDWQWWR